MRIYTTGRMALLFAALAALTSFFNEPQMALLRIRVGHVDCEGGANCGESYSLKVTIRGRDVVGWDVSESVGQEPADPSDPDWRLFEIPVGAKVAISASFSEHPLVEKWVDIKSSAQRDVTVLLESPRSKVRTHVDVPLPKGAPSWADGFVVLIKARETGHLIKDLTVEEVRKGFEIVPGKYDVEVRGDIWGGCGNGRPTPEEYARDSVELSLGDGARTQLRLQEGGLLKLTVDTPAVMHSV